MNVAREKGHRAGMNTVNPASNPYPRHSDEQWQWALGHAEGRNTRQQVMSREYNLYRTADPARYQLLWG